MRSNRHYYLQFAFISMLIISSISPIVFLSFIPSIEAAGPISFKGIIDENTTWSQENSPYLITGNILVEQDVVLTIEPGVEVRFDGYFYIKVEGGFKSIGTEKERIIFTSNKNSPEIGDWDKIHITKISDTENTEIRYSNISYAAAGIVSNNDTIIIRDSSVKYCGTGIVIAESVDIQDNENHCNISNNEITNNDYGIRIQYKGATIENCLIKENDCGIELLENEDNTSCKNNTIIDNQIGMICTDSSCSIETNLFFQNWRGMSLEGDDNILCHGNVFILNNYGIYIDDPINNINISFNNILNNTEYNVYLRSRSNISIPNNYYGALSVDEIDEKIYDYYEDFNKGYATFMPYLKSYFSDNNTPFNLLDPDHDDYPTGIDQLPFDPRGWRDGDGDGFPDELDSFPEDPLEWNDTDGDGYGDNLDIFPENSTEWKDTDEDGWGDNIDSFDDDPSEWNDTDGDGFGDNSDTFPKNSSEWSDKDGDGFGDNRDAFPEEPLEWEDTDGDRIGDNTDAFPNDPAASVDTDGDGYPDRWNEGNDEMDSKSGLELDDYPDDPDRWEKVEKEFPATVLIIILFVILFIVIMIVLVVYLMGKIPKPETSEG